MFGVVVYVGICMAVSGLITLLWTVIKPIQAHGEMRSWRMWIGLFVVCNMLPYGAFEVLTATVGSEMKGAVEKAVNASEVEGEISYYKVLFYNGKTADVVVVAEEDNSWGGKDRPVLRLKLAKSGGKWEATDTNIVYSDNLNKDGLVIPPYW